jgi:hypothetical protein
MLRKYISTLTTVGYWLCSIWLYSPVADRSLCYPPELAVYQFMLSLRTCLVPGSTVDPDTGLTEGSSCFIPSHHSRILTI